MERLRLSLGIHDEAMVENLDAVVSHGTVRRDHGICVKLTNVAYRSEIFRTKGTLDIHGDVFAALPAGLGSLAELMLPLKVTFERSDEGKVQAVLGARRLSRARLESTLDSVIAAGDPAFVFEVRSASCLVGLLPTRASLLKAGLAARASPLIVRLPADELPTIKRRSNLLKILRWWLCPLLFCSGCIALFWNPHPILQSTPAIFPVHGNATILSTLPPHPPNMSAAFQLGQLLQQYDAIGEEQHHLGTSILTQAATLVGRAEPLTPDDLKHMLSEIQRIESHKSLVTRVRGFFTFVNTIWVLASLGIAVSIGPSIYHVLVPIRDFIRRVVRWLTDKIIVPVARRLHQWGIFEVMAFSGCWLLVAQGYRMPDPDSAVMVAFSGTVLSIPAFGYSTILWAGRNGNDTAALKTSMQLWLASCAAPTAVALQSTLLGYLVVSAVFGALGFGVAATGLCWMIGFDDEDAMQRCSMASLMIVTLFTAARLSGQVPITLLQPFCAPATVLGNNVLFISQLIMSSLYYGPRKQYVARNLRMVALLLASGATGYTFGLTGMANVATTFLVLWLSSKYGELHLDLRWNGWVLLLLTSLFFYRAALWLHIHPSFVASVMSDTLLH